MTGLSRVPPDRCALLVIDAQFGFLTEHTAPAVPAMSALLARWQAAGQVSVITRFLNAPDSPYVRLIGWAAMMPGQPSVELVPDIAALAGSATLVEDKGTYSALTPRVRQEFARRRITDLIVTGFDTESCVAATMVAGWDLGFTPWLVTDAIGAHSGPAEHRSGLHVIGRNVGLQQFVTTVDVPGG